MVAGLKPYESGRRTQSEDPYMWILLISDNSNFWSPLQSKAFIWIYYWASTFKSFDSLSSTDKYLTNKQKENFWERESTTSVGCCFHVDSILSEVKISVKLILVQPSTLLQRPWAPPCWNNPLQSIHPKAGPPKLPPGFLHWKKWGHLAFPQSSKC